MVIKALKELLRKQYNIKDLGELRFFLGICVVRDRVNQKIAIVQDAYMTRILEAFKLTRINPKATPMATGLQLRKRRLDDPADKAYKKWYLEVVGSFTWLSCQTRPDISTAIGKLSRYSVNPPDELWTYAKRVFRYIQGTKDHGIIYGGKQYTPEKLDLEVYVDAAHGNNLDDRKSTQG